MMKRMLKSLINFPLKAIGSEILGPRQRGELQAIHAAAFHGPDMLTILAPMLGNRTVLQIGANDGGDTLGELIERHDLQAVLVEPQPRLVAKLRSRYSNNAKVKVEGCAIAAESGYFTLYHFEPEMIDGIDLSVFTSFDRSSLESWRRHRQWDVEILPLKVVAMTVGEICQKFQLTNNLGAIVVDTEGYDFEILKMVDFEQMQPIIVQIEHHRLAFQFQEQAATLLAHHGYAVVRNRYDMFGINLAALTNKET
jgi:FkbM family methyltransferase